MTKKTLKKKQQAKPSVSKLAEPILESAHDIWLAGLGAFSLAQNEGGKLIEQGNKLFDKLVEEGSKLEQKTRKAAGSKVEDIRGEVDSRVKSVRKQATDNWDRLETIFEDRVAKVLGRLGVPTSEEISTLSSRVQTLTNQVEKLAASQSGAAPKSAAKSGGKSAAGKSGNRSSTKKAKKATAKRNKSS